MKTYRKGADFEREICRLANSMGWLAIRGGGSKSWPPFNLPNIKIDIACMNLVKDLTICFQAKKGKSSPSALLLANRHLPIDTPHIKFRAVDNLERVREILG